MEFFLDGASVAGPFAVPALPAPSGNPLLVGRRVAPGSLPLDASLDEIAIWLRAVSDPEVSDLYNTGSGLALAELPTGPPSLAVSYVWDAFRDLPEGTFNDVHLRVTLSDGGNSAEAITGPLTVTTEAPTQVSTNARSLERRAQLSRTPKDFLGNGILVPFRRGSRDIVSGRDVELIKSSVAQVLGTRAAVGRDFPGELPWRPDFGSKLWILRHRNNDPTLHAQAMTFVMEAMRWEPRVEVTGVEVEVYPEVPENQLRVRVRYEIIQENVASNQVLLPEFEEVVTLAS